MSTTSPPLELARKENESYQGLKGIVGISQTKVCMFGGIESFG